MLIGLRSPCTSIYMSGSISRDFQADRLSTIGVEPSPKPRCQSISAGTSFAASPFKLTQDASFDAPRFHLPLLTLLLLHLRRRRCYCYCADCECGLTCDYDGYYFCSYSKLLSTPTSPTPPTTGALLAMVCCCCSDSCVVCGLGTRIGRLWKCEAYLKTPRPRAGDA